MGVFTSTTTARSTSTLPLESPGIPPHRLPSANTQCGLRPLARTFRTAGEKEEGRGARSERSVRSEATKTATGARCKAAKPCEYCAFSDRRFAPLHCEFHGDLLRSSLTPLYVAGSPSTTSAATTRTRTPSTTARWILQHLPPGAAARASTTTAAPR